MHYIERGDLPIDIKLVQIAISPFVIGRKSWLVADKPNGANASALLYLLVETAKAYGEEPNCWLAYLLKRQPFAKAVYAFDHLLHCNIKPHIGH